LEGFTLGAGTEREGVRNLGVEREGILNLGLESEGLRYLGVERDGVCIFGADCFIEGARNLLPLFGFIFGRECLMDDFGIDGSLDLGCLGWIDRPGKGRCCSNAFPGLTS
jgi:hypothetical protein